MRSYYQMSGEEVLQEVNGSLEPLTNEQVREHQEQYGPNELVEGKKKTILQIFLEQYKDFLVIILIIAAVASGFMGDVESAAVILIVITMNAILGTVQTIKAEQSLASLKKLSGPEAKVLRDGAVVQIPSAEVTVGDIVMLEAGDYIPADGRLLECASMKVDESALTGESLGVEKTTTIIKEENVPLGDRVNMVYSGSFVTYGRGSFLVTEIGMETEVGKIAGLLKNTSEKRTPLQVNLDQFGQKLSILILVFCGILFGISILRGDNIGDAFLFAVALAVAAIPEALSSIVTIVLSFGTQKMAKDADYLRAVDLQMTQDSWAVLRRQLKLDTQARTISDIRTIIFDYLREAMTYDETARTMNGSGDFLQYTLERSGHGYSVHYATAAVLMLRYMGVPARYVEGYYLSAEDAARYKAGETITLTEENAHAWAEYYVSGVGFVPFEVTPGYIDDEELSLGGDSPDENTYENNTQQFVEVEQPEEVNEHKQDRFTFSLNAHYLLLLPLLLILLLAGCIFHRRRVFRKKMAAIDAANDREAIAMRYGYAVCLLRHSTVQFSEDAAEAAELNQKALFSTQEMTPEQRKQVDSFAVRVLDACKGSWTTWEKIRYRLWNCLY